MNVARLPRHPTSEQVDAWLIEFEKNLRSAARASKRLKVVAGFTLLCFLLLAYRTEVNADAIKRSQRLSCMSGVQIIAQFNRQQETLADIERSQTLLPELRDRRIAAYTNGRIIPLPVCGQR